MRIIPVIKRGGSSLTSYTAEQRLKMDNGVGTGIDWICMYQSIKSVLEIELNAGLTEY